MHAYPDAPIFQGLNAPVRAEVDIHDLEVEGDVPHELQGAFYRVGPDWQFPPLHGRDILFNGDGAVSYFWFEQGRVHLKNRYVKTERFLLERAAGRALFGAYRNPYSDDPSVRGRKRNTANTNVLIHGNVLLALKEDSPPMRLDPVTLETLGEWDFRGGLTSPTFTAHPKIDPVNGEMLGFGYAVTGLQSPDVAYFVIAPDSSVAHEVRFEMPYFCMVHDFSVTEDYVVFHTMPCVGNGEEACKRGAPFYGFDGTTSIAFAVLPRRGTAKDIRWFRAPNQFAAHVMNAWNEGQKITIDAAVCDGGNLFPWFPDVHGKPFEPEKAKPRLRRWTIDLAAKSDLVEARWMTDFVGEFPRMDDRFQTRKYRHGWLLGFGGTRSALGHIDTVTGITKTWNEAEGTSFGEPCFVPRSANAPEGDGYVLQVLTSGATNTTSLLIFEALEVERGPIAKVKLPMRLRPAFHGNWHSAEQIAACKRAG